MKTTLQILTEARELLSDPKRWTRDTLARDADGKPTSERSPRAVCWCAEGAIHRVAESDYAARAAMDAVRHAAKIPALYILNDTGTHADVLAAVDRAIALASHSQTTEGK